MRIFITAGNTRTPIDRVRAITNVFSGRTGTAIAAEAARRGHQVTLATSHPELVGAMFGERAANATTLPYSTFDDLSKLMAAEISTGAFDVVVHVAAVSDFAVAGAYRLAAGTRFNVAQRQLNSEGGDARFVECEGAKLKSDAGELWLRLTPTAKLVDLIRGEWNFTGVLAKFKLEADVTDDELLAIGERSRSRSQADFLVANTFEGMREYAYLLGEDSPPERLDRVELPARLIAAVERRFSDRQ